MLLDRTRTVLNKLRNYPDIHLRDVKKSEKIFQEADFSGRNLKPDPPKYDTDMLLTAR
jgi:hypothetical protein